APAYPARSPGTGPSTGPCTCGCGARGSPRAPPRRSSTTTTSGGSTPRTGRSCRGSRRTSRSSPRCSCAAEPPSDPAGAPLARRAPAAAGIAELLVLGVERRLHVQVVARLAAARGALVPQPVEVRVVPVGGARVDGTEDRQ